MCNLKLFKTQSKFHKRKKTDAETNTCEKDPSHTHKLRFKHTFKTSTLRQPPPAGLSQPFSSKNVTKLSWKKRNLTLTKQK